MGTIFGREPAVVIGILAAVVLAVFQSLFGKGVIGPDLFNSVAGALDPTRGGWAIPVLVSIVTRFFVSPARK